MSEKKQYVKEGRVCKVLKWSGKGEKPALYPRVGAKVTASERDGRDWWCINADGPDCWIPANCLAVVPAKPEPRKKTDGKAAAGVGACA